MKCPVCNDDHHVEIDTHPDGFAQNLEECGSCGAVWTLKGDKEVVIHIPNNQALAVNS